MINGTAFAIGRIVIALLENYQTEQGNIKIPKVLQPYVGVKVIAHERKQVRKLAQR
jgi:seryl-tRNA synthetase